MSLQYWVNGFQEDFSIGFLHETTFFQDGVAGDQTTGESSPSILAASCFEPMVAEITGFLDHGGPVSIATTNTWQYTARAVNTNTAIQCQPRLWPYEDPPPDPSTVFVLDVSLDGVTWYTVDSYTTTSSSFFTRSGTFASAVVLPPTIRFVRLSGRYNYARIGLVSRLAVLITDFRDNVSDYTPPPIPPPRGNTTTTLPISTRGSQTMTCVIAQGGQSKKQIS